MEEEVLKSEVRISIVGSPNGASTKFGLAHFLLKTLTSLREISNVNKASDLSLAGIIARRKSKIEDKRRKAIAEHSNTRLFGLLDHP
jgi:hypothetical protein